MTVASKINKLFLTTICIATLIPYAIMIFACFSTNKDIKSGNLFTNLSLENMLNNFNALLSEEYYLNSMINSFMISIFSALLGVTLASMMGYAIVRYKSRISDSIFGVVFLSLMVPTSTILIPTFLIVKWAGFLDTYSAVIITSTSLPFLVYLFRQSTLLFPQEYIISAKIDGLPELSIFSKIFLPNIRNTLIASAMTSFFNAWNSVLIPVILLQSQEKFTNVLFLNGLGSFWNVDYGMLMMALALSTIPQVIIFLAFGKNIRSVFI